MAHLKIIVGLLVLSVTVLLNTRPANAQDDCTKGDVCKNKGTCPTGETGGGVTPCDCTMIDYSGPTCEDECKDDAGCDSTVGSCVDGTHKTCKCKDTSKKGPKCALENGATAVTGFSLMSLLVVLTGHFL